MGDIFILGSGGFAKEVFFLIDQIGGHNIKGFVDIFPQDDVMIGEGPVRVYGEEELLAYEGEAILAIGVGDPALIKKLTDKFASAFSFPNFIHPSVIGYFKDISLGSGNIITANCVFTTSIRIGSFNIFNLCCTVGHDVVIGDFNVINPAVNISGGVQIGNTNLIGVNSTILQYKHIGNNAVVGASSLVTKNVADGTTVIGIPALVYTKHSANGK